MGWRWPVRWTPLLSRKQHHKTFVWPESEAGDLVDCFSSYSFMARLANELRLNSKASWSSLFQSTGFAPVIFPKYALCSNNWLMRQCLFLGEKVSLSFCLYHICIAEEAMPIVPYPFSQMWLLVTQVFDTGSMQFADHLRLNGQLPLLFPASRNS